MKNSDANNPLKEKDLKEQKKETKNNESLKEEKETKPEQLKPAEIVPDPAPEPQAENEPELTPEAPPEIVPDPVPEPQAEKEPEPTPEAPPEIVPDPVPEPQAEKEPEPIPEAPPEIVPDPVPEPQAEKEPEPIPEAPPEIVPDPVPEPQAEKEPEPTPEAPPEKEIHKKVIPTADEELIDDHEEKLINATYDDGVDHEDHDDHAIGEEISDIQKEQAKPHAEERVNVSLLSKEDLVKLLSDKLDHPGKGNVRKDVEEIKQAFYEKINTTLEEKKAHFLAEGGDLEDFKPAEDPSEGEMKDLLYKYKGIKAEYTRQLEKTKQENLLKKQEILENLRMLMEGQENFEVTFRKFKELQKRWFSVGIVPQQNLKDLWDSYNYFVDKFNDYVRLNRDLRAMDLKKNLELKVQMCERTEELDNEPNIVQAFKALQKFHTRWREIGPVPRESRDEIWDRFKLATSLINKKHQEYHSRLKDSLHENLERKTALCENVEFIAATIYETHGAWVEKTKVVLEVQKTWKTIGYAPKKDNNAIYARFRKACDIFFGNKAKFYASVYDEQQVNLKLKMEIAERAEVLKASEEWKETTNELIRLQKQWKEIGPVPRRDSDKLWKRFRAACDTFFNSKSKYFEDIDSTFEDNLKAKEALIAEMDAFKVSENVKENLAAMEEFQSKFNAIGYVPSGKKDWIKEQFRSSLDKLLDRTGMGESERSIYKFRNRIKGMMNAPRSDMKLNFERDKLVNKLQQLKSDIGVWENNIGFFKQSDSSEETIQGFNEQIEAAHERIRVLEQKIRLLDDMENAN